MGLNLGKKKGLSEYARVRMGYGLTQSQMAEAVGLSGPVYSLHERQVRNTSLERGEKLFYEVNHAGHRIVKEKERKAHDLSLNTYKPEGKIMKALEEEIQDELDFELHYEQLTEKKFQEALAKYVMNGKTVVRAAAELGVCELELKRKLERNKIPYIMGDNWESLVK